MTSRFAFIPMTCSRNGQFLMSRFERTEAAWSLVGASVARRSTSEVAGPRDQITGGIVLDAAYTGCPVCGANSIVRCGRCSELNCWDSTVPQFHCASCGNSGQVSGTIDSLRRSAGR